MGGRGDASGPVDIDPDIVVASELAFPRVETHADPHFGVFRPGVGRQCLLGCARTSDGLRSGGESEEEGISLRGNLDSPGFLHRLADEPAVGSVELSIFIAKALEESCGTLYIAE